MVLDKAFLITYLLLFIILTVIYCMNEEPLVLYSAWYCAGLAGGKFTEIIIPRG